MAADSQLRQINRVLIANRGEIAVRIEWTCRTLGIATVAVYSDADARALPVLEADQAVPTGPAPLADSYLNIETIIQAAHATAPRRPRHRHATGARSNATGNNTA